MNQPTEPRNDISAARPVDGPSQLEAYVDGLVAVCERAELHYFPAARASTPGLGA